MQVTSTNADLLIAADCVPFAFADFHREFLKDKIAIIFCPKLDPDIEGTSQKCLRYSPVIPSTRLLSFIWKFRAAAVQYTS